MSNIKKFRIIKFKSKPILSAKSISKSFGGRVILRKIDINLNKGEMLGMLGSNGAGKSTSVEIVEGIRKMDRGYVRVLGLDPLSDSARLRNRIGIQLQSTSLYPKLNVMEHLKMFGRLYERSRNPDEIIDLIGLRERVSGLSQDLSGGQQQRLSVGLAMINDPEIVFLDEPTTGMDPQARRHLYVAKGCQ